MAFSINTLNSLLYSTLNKANTTTASIPLSGSVTSGKVQAIYKTYADSYPVPVTMYPVIFIEAKSSKDDWNRLGRSAYREITANYDIVAITSHGMGVELGREESDKDMFTLAANIERILRASITLSTTALGAPNVDTLMITNVDYNAIYSNDTWNSVARISVEIKTDDN